MNKKFLKSIKLTDVELQILELVFKIDEECYLRKWNLNCFLQEQKAGFSYLQETIDVKKVVA